MEHARDSETVMRNNNNMYSELKLRYFNENILKDSLVLTFQLYNNVDAEGSRKEGNRKKIWWLTKKIWWLTLCHSRQTKVGGRQTKTHILSKTLPQIYNSIMELSRQAVSYSKWNYVRCRTKYRKNYSANHFFFLMIFMLCLKSTSEQIT